MSAAPPLAMAKDAMIRRLERDMAEETTKIDAIVSTAEGQERDLNDLEMTSINEYRSRVGKLTEQLSCLEGAADIGVQYNNRLKQLGAAQEVRRQTLANGPVEYRSAGEYALDQWRAGVGNREAAERMDLYFRTAAHQKTSDEPGLVPDPILGPVINFIDAARPTVNYLGARAMPPSGFWHRPLVTQHTAVAIQGSAGLAADEKTELTSQKMTITRLTGNAVTYGGYVNVSRQSIDFSQPGVLDIIITDLAAQYAIDTEAATVAAINAVGTTGVGYGATPTNQTVATAVWGAAAQVYAAVKGQGQLFIVVPADALATFGSLFAPYGPFNQFGEGFNASNFKQGVMGNISGIPVVMSAGLPTGTGKSFLLSTAALEVYEQRVGTLQVVEPSVMGLQVAYAGYFTPLTINAAGIVPLTKS